MSSNLPPGVTESMIPGNRPEDRAFDEATEWGIDQFVGAGFDGADIRRAVKIGIAAIKAEESDVADLLQEARHDERMLCNSELAQKDD
jgi:hypothetical protein